jgi:thiol:disulfide interchange protein DsbD
MPKPPNNRAPEPELARRTWAVLIAAAVVATAARAATPDLLPPERAFAFSARGLDPSTVEARFAVADGYYLYRDKMRFTVEPNAIAGTAALPAGKWKEDAFFGRVETYRGDVVVRLPLERAAAGSKVVVKAESQGCADIGVCYPPTVQQVTIGLPESGARPGTLVEANPAKRRWFQ